MLKNFYVGARYLFGYLAPGSLWVAGALLLLGIDLKNVVANPSPSHVVIFLTVSFVVGHATTPLSFNLGVALSLAWDGIWIGMLHRGTEDRDGRSEARLIPRIRDVLKQNYADESLPEEQIPLLCKRFVLEMAPRFAHDINELEAEINLRATSPFAIVFFAGVWVSRYPEHWSLILGASVVIAGLLLRPVAPLQRLERRTWCEFFLVAQAIQATNRVTR